MGDDKSSVMGEWSVIDHAQSEWSIITDQYNDEDESELSMSTNDPSEQIALCNTAIILRHASPKTLLQQINEKEEEDQDNHSEEYELYKKLRVGKRALKHSLVKRAWACGDKYNDDFIELTHRGKDEDGMSRKTPIDDLLPELLSTQGCATLGRADRWTDVKTLFEHLEQEGTAVRIACNEQRYRGRDSEPPHDSIRYVVKGTGTFKASPQEKRYHYFNTEVYCWQHGRWKVWYELSFEPPPDIGQSTPLRATLRAPPGSKALARKNRHAFHLAFSPGVAFACGATRAASIDSAVKGVAEREVDLVFGRPVSVTHAAVAGKIHDTRYDCLNMKRAEDYPPRYYNNVIVIPDGAQKKKKCHVALEGTDAYCDRVEISARLGSNPRTWVILGSFDGCKDGHTEKAIFLGDCHAASKAGFVCCVALRFRAVSWHNKPLLRVGAYGYDNSPETKDQGYKAVFSNDDTGFEDGVVYTLHLSKHDDGGSDAVRRRYANKESRSDHYWTSRSGKCSKAMRRARMRFDIIDALQ